MAGASRLRMDDERQVNHADGARARLALVATRPLEENVQVPAVALDADMVPVANVESPSLLSRIADGDEHAVRACVDRYGALVWSLARRWSADAGDAEDAVQEVFIDLWRSASRFDATRATEAGWVAMIARRRLIDRARRSKRSPALEPYPAGFDAEDESERDRDAELDLASRAERARAVLRTLPDAQRRMLELSLLDGKTHDEIARETDMPLGTVKSHIRRGLLRARALLQPIMATREDMT